MDDFFKPTSAQYHFDGPGSREPLDRAVADSKPAWWALAQLLPCAAEAQGAAAGHDRIFRDEAAFKLMENFEAVLRDVCNPSPTHNIIGSPLKQPELRRCPMVAAGYASQCLREVCRRLLGNKPGAEEIREGLSGDPDQVVAWIATCSYLMCRIQDHRDHMPGRNPDMAYGAAFAARAVLQEVIHHALGLC